MLLMEPTYFFPLKKIQLFFLALKLFLQLV